MATPHPSPADGHPDSIADLRLRVVLNHFKRLLLGIDHVPGAGQGFALFEAMEEIDPVLVRKAHVDDPDPRRGSKVGMKASQRSWDSWFEKSQVRPKSGHIAALDEVAKEFPRWFRPRDGLQMRLPAGFYEDLYERGLLTTMLTDLNPRRSRQNLRSRAESYQPKSAWHLHLDALEVLNFAATIRDIDADEVVNIAGARIFDVLYSLWGDLTHPAILDSIYVQLRSDAQTRWDAKSDDDKDEDLADPLLGLMDTPERELFGRLSRTPNFALLGRASDVTPGRIYRMLFGIASDTEFLRGGALNAWALDLATAGATGVALFYAGSPYLKPIPEQVVINAIDSLMMGLHVDGVAAEHRANLWGGPLEDVLQAAMKEVGAVWTQAGTANLLAARRAYEDEMRELGVRVTDIYKIKQRKSLRKDGALSQATRPHPTATGRLEE